MQPNNLRVNWEKSLLSPIFQKIIRFSNVFQMELNWSWIFTTTKCLQDWLLTSLSINEISNEWADSFLLSSKVTLYFPRFAVVFLLHSQQAKCIDHTIYRANTSQSCTSSVNSWKDTIHISHSLIMNYSGCFSHRLTRVLFLRIGNIQLAFNYTSHKKVQILTAAK